MLLGGTGVGPENVSPGLRRGLDPSVEGGGTGVACRSARHVQAPPQLRSAASSWQTSSAQQLGGLTMVRGVRAVLAVVAEPARQHTWWLH